ncbi:MAG: LysM peptidoglycan-binding domain-containing protein [Pseudomonadota bacterium]
MSRLLRYGIYSLLTMSLLLLLPLREASPREEAEETYSISLVQTAEIEKNKEIKDIDDKKVLTESYTVKKGDHVWQLFRERGLLEKRNLPQLLAVLKRLNKSLSNLDLIHPGERIVIPLTISPVAGLLRDAAPTTISLEDLKNIRLENYTVKPGDALIRVVKDLYQVPDEALHEEYLSLLKRLNPEVKDLNLIHPGQVVRLPIYHPEIVRIPIKHDKVPESGGEGTYQNLGPLSKQLMEIFSFLGEEWVNSGEHFIPLKSGGQINLKADSFPILSLTNGNRVVVDLYNDLPQKMAEIITSNWENYRIVHLEKGADLRIALDRILSACNYHKIYKNGEPLELGGDILLRMTADWIVKPSASPAQGKGKTVLIILADPARPRIPQEIKDFLETLDIVTLEYPPGNLTKGLEAPRPDILKSGSESFDLVEFLLNLVGQSFSRDSEIKLYQGNKTDFNLVVKADFLLDVKGRDCIIDLSGLGQEILSLLKERQFSVLPLAGEKDAVSILSKTLAFAGVEFDSKPHPFMATDTDESRNIRLTIPGVIFKDAKGQGVFATRLTLPDKLLGFLSRKGYRILSLPLS